MKIKGTQPEIHKMENANTALLFQNERWSFRFTAAEIVSPRLVAAHAVQREVFNSCPY